MDFNVFIEFRDNKMQFILNLPLHLMDKNEDAYIDNDGRIIFETDNINFDLNIIKNKIKSIINNLKIEFGDFNLGIDEETITYIMNDSLYNGNELPYNFIKKFKNINIAFNVEKYKALIDNLKDEDYTNLKILFDNSDENISYKEFYQMYSKLNQIIEFIKYYNLSPLEQVLLVYDIVKANEYNKESENEDYSISRDLNQIVNNNKIVCVGFSNLMDFLLTNIGFDTNLITLNYTNSNIGHRRNAIHLKDNKYNIDGIYFLDATWDSKRNKNYIDNYNFFLKSARFFCFANKNEHILSPNIFKLLEMNEEEIFDKFKTSKEKIKISFNISTLIYKFSKKRDYLLDLNTKSDEEIREIIHHMYSKYNQRISKKTFKNALYKVRKIEYLNKLINFIPDEQYIDSVCDKLYPNLKENKILKVLGIYEEPTLDKSLNDSNANSVEQDLLRIRLLKAFKEKLNDFPDNDYIKKM